MEETVREGERKRDREERARWGERVGERWIDIERKRERGERESEREKERERDREREPYLWMCNCHSRKAHKSQKIIKNKNRKRISLASFEDEFESKI